jgi:hypothetical protein
LPEALQHANRSFETCLLRNRGDLVKITHLKLGQVGTSGSSKRQVTICAELDGPQEFMTITVCVPIVTALCTDERSHFIMWSNLLGKCLGDVPDWFAQFCRCRSLMA